MRRVRILLGSVTGKVIVMLGLISTAATGVAVVANTPSAPWLLAGATTILAIASVWALLDKVGELDSVHNGGSDQPGSTAWLLDVTGEPDLRLVGDLVRDLDDVILQAVFAWPDRSEGEYVAVPSSLFPGAVESYTITYRPKYGPNLMVTQPPMIRDASGAVISRPPRTVS